MNPESVACDASQLDLYLCEALDIADQKRLEHHLDSCAKCRSELAALAASDQQWQNAESFLPDQPDDLTSLCGTIAGQNDEATELRSAQISAVLATLDPTDDPQMLGRIGGYEVAGVIGSGGMGVVLKAHERSLDRVVAIKVMSPHLASSPSARKRFAREARAAAAVLHPNVIAIHRVSNEAKLPFIVMSYINGESLQTRIDRVGGLPIDQVLRIGQQIAGGLSAAHEQGLVHRDIKPANILLQQGVDRVFITDFGLARACDDVSLTCSGMIAGTPMYMSPEQARGESLDGRSDLFSLGSVIYVMCTGQPPFADQNSYGVIRQITEAEPPSIADLQPAAPVWLQRFVRRLHRKHPHRRIETAAECESLLRQCLVHHEQPQRQPVPSRLAYPIVEIRGAWLAVSAGLVVALTVLLLMFMSSSENNGRSFEFEHEVLIPSSNYVEPAQALSAQSATEIVD